MSVRGSDMLSDQAAMRFSQLKDLSGSLAGVQGDDLDPLQEELDPAFPIIFVSDVLKRLIVLVAVSLEVIRQVQKRLFQSFFPTE
jgi:hypothetical protein